MPKTLDGGLGKVSRSDVNTAPVPRALLSRFVGCTCLVIAACGSPAPAKHPDMIHERVLRVVRDGQGGATVHFELSQRLTTIDPDRSPSAAAMIAFAEAAVVRHVPVFATIDSGPLPRTKGDGLGAFVLMRLADTPDPGTTDK